MSSDVSLVIPTYNESGSLPAVMETVSRLADEHSLDLEIIVVDDMSPDGTAEVARRKASELGGGAPGGPEGRFRILERRGPRGLTPAVAYGFEHAGGEFVGVCDADGSHDLRILPRMLELLASGEWDLVVGSRYIPGGGADETWPMKRYLLSRLAALSARPLTPVRDPMAGFFFLRKSLLERAPVGGSGYKVLLEILVRAAPGRVVEVPYVFRDRTAGESKLGAGVVLRDLRQLVGLYLFRLRHPLTRTRLRRADAAERSPGARDES